MIFELWGTCSRKTVSFKLLRADIAVGHDDWNGDDIYVTVSIGSAVHTSTRLDNNMHPVWNDSNTLHL